MPEAGPPNDLSREESPQRPAPRKRSMFEDPVVRNMGYASFALVVLFLVAVLSVFISGITANTGPRTLAEKELAVSAAAVQKGSTDASLWGTYISSLIESGDYGRARRVIADGKASLDDSATAEFGLAEARLNAAQKKYDAAIASADQAMAQIEKVHKKRLAAGGNVAKAAKLEGLPENYYNAVLIKAYAYRDTKQWDKAIEQFTIYLKRYTDAADIMIDRGNAYISAGNNSAAEKDFRKALTFVPGDTEALAGLDKIGAKR